MQLLAYPPDAGLDNGPVWTPCGSYWMETGLVANWSRYTVQQRANSLAVSELQTSNEKQDLAQPLAFPPAQHPAQKCPLLTLFLKVYFKRKKTHEQTTQEPTGRGSRDKHCLGSPWYSTAPTCDIVDYPAVSCLAALAEAAVPGREDLQVILAHQGQAPAWKRQWSEQKHARKHLVLYFVRTLR